MIDYIKRKDLNVVKYDACVENALQSRIYAYSWYLDIVADNWDVLVLDDYEAVMPIPWKQKYFIKYVTQPLFCQQLGVFSKATLSKKLLYKLIESIPKKFLKVSLNFNSDNQVSGQNTRLKSNFLLPIENTLIENYKKFNKNRKRSLKKSQKNFLYVDVVNFNALLLMAEKEKKYLKNFKFDKLQLLIQTLQKIDRGFLLGVYNKEHELLGGTFFLNEKHRITYLFSVMNGEGKRLNAATYLIYDVLNTHVNKGWLLDFEGSNITGVADFFKSFGAKAANYSELVSNIFPVFLKNN
jgi:hypothetical protein